MFIYAILWPIYDTSSRWMLCSCCVFGKYMYYCTEIMRDHSENYKFSDVLRSKRSWTDVASVVRL